MRLTYLAEGKRNVLRFHVADYNEELAEKVGTLSNVAIHKNSFTLTEEANILRRRENDYIPCSVIY